MPLVRRRRPLLRAAVVGGAAYTAGKRNREAAGQTGQQEYPPANQPAPPSAGMSPAAMERLKEMAELHDQGILTDAEFEQQKRVLLGGGQ